ncbi:MAG TPA: hypothetical protein VG963_20650 [Polyangiaceae bacterium]|nr:hypothetical protein [Polyangiaceae bacterium]
MQRQAPVYVLIAVAWAHYSSYIDATTGGTAGIDIKLMQVMPDPIWNFEILLSVGVRRLFTGPMASPAYTATMNDGVQTTAAHAHLHLWQPFLSLCLSGISKPQPPPDMTK